MYPPYKVDLVDMFEGQSEEGYGNIGIYDNLEEAIKAARKITEESLGSVNNKIEKWVGMGDAGLVYDLKGNLVWDGIKEYTEAGKLKKLIEDDSTGFKEIFKAIEFAVKAHADQLRKGTNIPYIVHLLRVTETLLKSGCNSPHLLVAAILHDVVEDVKVPLIEIRNIFGDKVSEIVNALSERNKNDTWENRKKETIDQVKNLKLDILWVECADKLDNIRAIHNDYVALGEKVWERFNRGKEQQRWYYQSLAKAFLMRKENEKITILIDEFVEQVKAVFL